LILGIDDAGRGPVVGPMVLAGCLIDKKIEKEFKKENLKQGAQTLGNILLAGIAIAGIVGVATVAPNAMQLVKYFIPEDDIKRHYKYRANHSLKKLITDGYIQEKIKTLVKENLSATESTLKEKINQRTLVGFVGLIQSINSGNITINTKDGTILQITTDEKSVYNKAGTGIKISSLAISDKIIVIGTLLKEDIVLAKRIVVVPDEPIQIVSGTIVSKVSSVDIKKKLIGLTVNNQEVLFGLTKKSTIKIEEIKAGMTIFAITKKYDGKDLLSRAKIL